MKAPLSWIREFVDVKASAEEIGALMGVRGLALEGLDTHGDEVVMDFDVTANRPDCLSVIGIAREIATVYQLPLRVPGGRDFSPAWSDQIPVTIEEPELCGRYVAATADVTVGPSPQWMQDRLLANGVRPISNIVDITNYVMIELGQPMHAFDLAKMRGGVIKVRRAKPGETMTTLDGKKRTLTADMLVIADADNAEDIGGVMGGANSEIGMATKRVVFEAAYFAPAQIRATSTALGIKTEASTRFERGMDRTAPPRAMARALELLEKIGAGTPTGAITDNYPRPYQPQTLRLEHERIVGLLGMDVPGDQVSRILTTLGFQVALRSAFAASPASPSAATADRVWDVVAPPWRVDVNRQVDLIEEVGRHYGFEHLPATFPGVEQAPPPSDPRIARDRKIRTALLGMGFSEAITFAFIEQSAAGPFDERPLVKLANPLSEKFAVMRPSLLPVLIDSLSHNRRHGLRDVRLFEIGTRFSTEGESRAAAGVWTGLAVADYWGTASRNVDFSDMKGVVEQLLKIARLDEAVFESPQPLELLYLADPKMIERRAAKIFVKGIQVGVLGQLDSWIAELRGVPESEEVYVAELDLDALTTLAPAEPLRAKPLPRFPSVVRDLSVLVDHRLSAATVRGTIRSAAQPSREASAGPAPATLIQIREFDRYQGKGVPDGKVSLSFRLTFQSPERTLTDDEVSEAMAKIVTALKLAHNAEQR